MVEMADQGNLHMAEVGLEDKGMPSVNPKATAETLVYPKDQNLGIPSQKATSTFVRFIVVSFY